MGKSWEILKSRWLKCSFNSSDEKSVKRSGLSGQGASLTGISAVIAQICTDIHVHGGFVIFLSAPCEVRVRQSVPLSHWYHANILKAVCKSYGKQAHLYHCGMCQKGNAGTYACADTHISPSLSISISFLFFCVFTCFLLHQWKYPAIDLNCITY